MEEKSASNKGQNQPQKLNENLIPPAGRYTGLCPKPKEEKEKMKWWQWWKKRK